MSDIASTLLALISAVTSLSRNWLHLAGLPHSRYASFLAVLPSPQPSLPNRGPLKDVATAFLRLGLTSFGGPAAHLGYFRRAFVEERGWIDEADYASLLALCQLLPGPTSSQVAFGLGWRRAGLPGAAVASAAFILPSALLMLLLAAAANFLGLLSHGGWVNGIQVAAVAVVAHALLGMARSLCRTLPTATLGLLSAATTLFWGLTTLQPLILLAGGIAGFWVCRGRSPGPKAKDQVRGTGSRRGSVACLALWFALLAASFLATGGASEGRLVLMGRFFRAGSLVVGGGHVVLPLLRAELVPPGWLDEATFLAGYGVAQLMPGPLFSVAAYYGSLARSGGPAWGLLSLLALYLPGWLSLLGALPFWSSLRARPALAGAFAGMSASAVGLLGAAWIRPLCSESLNGAASLGVALAAFSCLAWTRLPAWSIVLTCAIAGWACL